MLWRDSFHVTFFQNLSLQVVSWIPIYVFIPENGHFNVRFVRNHSLQMVIWIPIQDCIVKNKQTQIKLIWKCLLETLIVRQVVNWKHELFYQWNTLSMFLLREIIFPEKTSKVIRKAGEFWLLFLFLIFSTNCNYM